jgi:hypothetical protein
VQPRLHPTKVEEDFLIEQIVDCFPFLAPLSYYFIWSYIFLSKGSDVYDVDHILSEAILAHSPDSRTQFCRLIGEDQDLLGRNWYAIHA